MSLDQDVHSVDQDDDRDRLASLADCLTKRETFRRSAAKPAESAPVLQVRIRMHRHHYRADNCEALKYRQWVCWRKVAGRGVWGGREEGGCVKEPVQPPAHVRVCVCVCLIRALVRMFEDTEDHSGGFQFTRGLVQPSWIKRASTR